MTPEQIDEALKRAKEWKPIRITGPVAIDAKTLASRLIRRIEPIYPDLAKRARVSGRVDLVVTVDGSGNVVNFRVTSGHPLLDEAAANAVRQWKYSPMEVNGESVTITGPVTILFNVR